jgi:hypothetical protein
MVRLRPHGGQPVEGGGHVVDVPVHDGSGRPGRALGHPAEIRYVRAVENAELVLVVADAELDVRRPHGRPT